MRYLLFFHIVGIALAIGSSFARLQLLREASKGGSDALTFVLGARAVQVKTQLPGYILALVTGVGMLATHPAILTQGKWLHLKITLVLLLFGLLHYEGRQVKKGIRLFGEGKEEEGRKITAIHASKYILLPSALFAAIIFLAKFKPF